MCFVPQIEFCEDIEMVGEADDPIFSPLFFSYQGAQQVPDVKGLQDPGPPCASISCSNFAHAT